MTRPPRHSKGWFPYLRRVGSVTLAAVGIVLGSATAAAAYFTLTHLGTGAARAGSIGAPTTFAATSAFPNQATLSWKAPSDHTPTGYTLTGPLGTGSTCTASPSAVATSCTVDGLVQGTKYTWHLVAKYQTWSSTPVAVTTTTVTPSINLAPTTGKGGTVVKVTGSGFAATSALTFGFTPTGGSTGPLTPTNCTPTTTATGALPGTPCAVTIPLAAATGAGTVTVTDAAGNTATATFTVTPSPVGLGTMTVTPPAAVASSTGDTFEFDFTAGAGGMTKGTVTLAIPSGWTAPSLNATAAGHVTLTPKAAGTLAITGTRTLQLSGVTLAAGRGFDLLYGAGGGSTGVTVTSTLGTAIFLTKEASTSSGAPATLAVQPTVNVTATCTPITGTHTLAAGATTHFLLRGASGGNGGNTGGTGAGGTVVSGTLTNNNAAAVTLTYTLGCKGSPGESQNGGPGSGGGAGGAGGTGHSDKAGGGGGGGGASALTFTVTNTTTVVAVAGGGGGGAGVKFGAGAGGGSASPTKDTASTTTPAVGAPGTSPGSDSTNGGTGGGGGGGGVHHSAPGGNAGAGGTGGTSYFQGNGTATGITFSHLSVTTGTSGATATVIFT